MRSQAFFIPGPLPGLNEIMAANLSRHGRWNQYHVMKQVWEATCVRVIQQSQLPKMEWCFLTFTWRERNQRRDPDNIAVGKKFICDALIKADVLTNDGWNQIRGFEDFWEVNKESPGVVVEVRG